MGWYLLSILYLVLLVFGFKPTWHWLVDLVLAGSSELFLTIIIFILLVLIIGPFIGLYHITKLVIAKYQKP